MVKHKQNLYLVCGIDLQQGAKNNSLEWNNCVDLEFTKSHLAEDRLLMENTGAMMKLVS